MTDAEERIAKIAQNARAVLEPEDLPLEARKVLAELQEDARRNNEGQTR